jgi:hypothetical protein
MPSHCVVGVVVVCGAIAQVPQWYPATLAMPAPHEGGAFAYDSVRDRIVVAGGMVDYVETFPTYFTDTWEWDGSHWLQRLAAGFPHRYGHQMAFDPLRRRMVTFGGETRQGDPPGFLTLDTLEYDGESWRSITNVGPAPREGHAMTYDPVLHRVLLFGGYGNATWAWDGTTWSVLNAAGPPGRVSPAHAYDTVRNRWVVFGGRPISSYTPLADLWEWDSVAWTQRTPATMPPAASGTMAFDPLRGRAVLNVGYSVNATSTVDLWEWDGVAWFHVLTRTLDHIIGPGVWNARAGAVVYQGLLRQDSWDGTTLTTLPTGLPDTPLSVLGTRDDTLVLVTALHVWNWQSGEWREVGPAFPGYHDYEAAVVEDTVRHRLVCVVPSGPLGSYVNEWDGTAWDGPIGGARVPKRTQPGVAFDRLRGTTVLFGGWSRVGSGGLVQDTWEWQLGLWQQRTPATAPSPRSNAAMCFDPQLGKVLLFGGATTSLGNGYVNDTWAWNGSAWRQLAPATTPPAVPMTMVLNEVENRPWLFSRWPTTTGRWRWTGADWQFVAGGAGYADAFDRARGEFVGGQFVPLDFAPRFLGPQVAPGVQARGSGCGSPAPRLLASTPFLGNPALAFDIDAAPSSLAALVLGTQPASVSLGNGCSVLVGGTVGATLTFTNAGGSASVHKVVPAAPGLLGLQLHAQMFALEAGTGTLTATAARGLTIGN